MGMAIQKVFAFVRRDASNVEEIIQPSIIHAERNPKTLNSCKGNFPANYKNCMLYKNLERNFFPTL